MTPSKFEKKRAAFLREPTRAGQALPGEKWGALRLARGALAKPPPRLARRHQPDAATNVEPTRLTFKAAYNRPGL